MLSCGLLNLRKNEVLGIAVAGKCIASSFSRTTCERLELSSVSCAASAQLLAYKYRARTRNNEAVEQNATLSAVMSTRNMSTQVRIHAPLRTTWRQWLQCSAVDQQISGMRVVKNAPMHMRKTAPRHFQEVRTTSPFGAQHESYLIRSPSCMIMSNWNCSNHSEKNEQLKNAKAHLLIHSNAHWRLVHKIPAKSVVCLGVRSCLRSQENNNSEWFIKSVSTYNILCNGLILLIHNCVACKPENYIYMNERRLQHVPFIWILLVSHNDYDYRHIVYSALSIIPPILYKNSTPAASPCDLVDSR